MKNNISAILFAIAIIVAAFILGNAVINRNKAQGTIHVTGLGETNFTSDLIVWEGNFSRESRDIKSAYSDLEKDRKAVTEYLKSKGIPADQLVFNAVITNPMYQQNYSNDGRYMGQTFTGYQLNQSLKIESKEVEKVEKTSREITELLNQGIAFYSQPPRYYYTGLESLKLEMVAKATEDARVRAERIAENSQAKLGDLINANMGIFQITGQNSGEDYSWGGTFNTSSKNKTASITMKLTFEVD
ncbi:SIMPL domain-containing protein [Algoriphagus sp. CAU 1675]|uniref:SIMPL domain-containing protein n=1 Tax=Algoriphagus sp. CAU 1675 TaxID=3032597 RepID=UPI0023DB57DE|nr:SIMPL domain-containing protein [Algoriphagus sp. CAU 1675]MDF2156595.1 SIMPL domain-containing protein [Algoriphagus sp. CAU 1675]